MNIINIKNMLELLNWNVNNEKIIYILLLYFVEYFVDRDRNQTWSKQFNSKICNNCLTIARCVFLGSIDIFAKRFRNLNPGSAAKIVYSTKTAHDVLGNKILIPVCKGRFPWDRSFVTVIAERTNEMNRIKQFILLPERITIYSL